MHDELKELMAQSMNNRLNFENKLVQKAWENETFKKELLSNPRAVYARESGQELPQDVQIEVIQETENKVYLVLPKNTSSAEPVEELSDEALEAVAGGVCINYSQHYKRVKVLWTAYCKWNAGDKV